MSKDELLRRCLERVDQLTVSDGAMTFLDVVLDDMLNILHKAPPWSPRETEVLRLVGEWPRRPGAVPVIDWPENERPSPAPNLDRRYRGEPA